MKRDNEWFATKRPNVWFGAGLYSSVKPEDVERFLRVALIDGGGEVAGVQMEMIVTMRPGSERISRPREVTPKMLDDILRGSVQGKVGSIGAYSSWHDMNAPIPDDPEEGYITLDINLADNYDKVHTITLEGPCKLYRQEELIGYVRENVCETRVDYGCIVSGWDLIRVSSVLTLIGQDRLEEFLYFARAGQEDHPLIHFKNEIGFYNSHRVMRQLDQWIPRANWGTVLSPVHIEKLGGEDRIRKECGCYLVECWGENLYLQLTESLWDVSKKQLLALNHYFEPIRFPDSPEPVYLEEP